MVGLYTPLRNYYPKLLCECTENSAIQPHYRMDFCKVLRFDILTTPQPSPMGIDTKKPRSQGLRGFCTQSRDRTGMEVNPLVFETSASTNSAIWAFDFGCKVKAFF